ncbi:MAG TPA: radical SAM protein [Thermomicrobiaceae bacterium]|nr:radical SAM protein [Thermomicrobiaceae bacterium]
MRIAMIAMSGVRAHNPELTRLGLTLPGFAERARVLSSLPSLSLLTLAGMTPERHDVRLYEIADIRRLDTLPECDLAAITTLTAQAKDAYELARRFREQGVPTVMGGLHATLLPGEVRQHCDAVVVGEGELSWPGLLEDVEHRCLRPVYTPYGREFDLAEAPLPRFDLLQIEKYNRLTVQTQRGCPWRCEFCASSIRLTGRYKVKPIDKVIGEIRAIKSIWRHPFIEFADDNTFVNKPHAKALMRALAPEGVPWFTESDVSVADDPELLALIAEAGCREILIGFESPTAAGLDQVELRRNWKRRRLDGYKAAIERIQSHGIAVNGCFVLGLDGDTPAVFEAIHDFVRDAGLFDVQVTVMTPFPGTPLYRRLQAEERLLVEGAWERCTLFDVNLRPSRMTVRELEDGLLDLVERLYAPEAKQARTRAFRHQVRRGRRATANAC